MGFACTLLDVRMCTFWPVPGPLHRALAHGPNRVCMRVNRPLPRKKTTTFLRYPLAPCLGRLYLLVAAVCSCGSGSRVYTPGSPSFWEGKNYPFSRHRPRDPVHLVDRRGKRNAPLSRGAFSSFCLVAFCVCVWSVLFCFAFRPCPGGSG